MMPEMLSRRGWRQQPRGFAAIGLVNPKTEHNVGSVLRAAGCFGAALVVVQGRRYQRAASDTMSAYRHIPMLQVEHVLDAIPFDCVPIGVELVEGAKPLETFPHPPRAFYVFGPEDGSIPPAILGRCRDVLIIPSSACLNLAATVNVVLYDREAKRRLYERTVGGGRARTESPDHKQGEHER